MNGSNVDMDAGAGKSKFARRNLCLTARAKTMLEAEATATNSTWDFPGNTGKPYGMTSLDPMRAGVRALHRPPKNFVVDSLRHTFGARMGAACADAFEMKRLMGRSGVTVSQRYVHTSPEAVERALERLEDLHETTITRLQKENKLQRPATISATSTAS